MVSKQEKVENSLKQKILSGNLIINQKLPTETELMEEFDVSRFTIRSAIDHLANNNFVYRIQGSGMYVADWHNNKISHSKNNFIIGVITTYITNYIFPDIINGIDKVASKNNYTLLLANTRNDSQRERKALLAILDNRVAGLVVEPTQSGLKSPNKDLYRQLDKLNIPVVFINATYPDLDKVSITADDKQAAIKLTNYLINKGHKHILGVFQVDDRQGIFRMQGFIKACRINSEITSESDLVMYQSHDPLDQTLNKIKQKIKSSDPPTALICYNDQLAVSVINMLKRMYLSVPQDISIVGFDDYLIDKYLSPTLTTMKHKKEYLGKRAVEMLIQLINKKRVKSVKYIPKLIIRDSVKDINR